MRILVLSASLALAPAACGDDDDGTDSGASTLTAGTNPSESSSSSVGNESTSSGDATSSDDGGSSSSAAEVSSSDDAADSSSGGGPEDPSYPAPDGSGTCPADTAPILLGSGSVCAPLCAGADAPCPSPSSGDAVPTCTPFEQEGGSGTACTEHADCPDEEACGVEDTCVAVAFWGCRLECAGGETCSDGMSCTVGACAYP